MELRTCSKARPAANIAKEDAKGTKPMVDAPAAAVIMVLLRELKDRYVSSSLYDAEQHDSRDEDTA